MFHFSQSSRSLDIMPYGRTVIRSLAEIAGIGLGLLLAGCGPQVFACNDTAGLQPFHSADRSCAHDAPAAPLGAAQGE